MIYYYTNIYERSASEKGNNRNLKQNSGVFFD